MPIPARPSFDLAILGGGLAGGLIALALAERRPELSVVLVEQEPALGGNHLWSFFGSDLAREHRWLLERLVVRGWRGYDVAFPAHRRTLPTAYYSVTSQRLDHELRQTLPPRAIRTGARVVSVLRHAPDERSSVMLADGTRIETTALIDARGARLAGELTGGWQKFIGRMLRLEAPHGLERPLVMDAAVEQPGDFRFVYCLPFSPTQVFVEDTYYSTSDRLDRTALGKRIDDYAAARGWRVTEVLGEEAGLLPVVTGGGFERFWRATGEHGAKAGVRAGLFHPLTSYSLPDAVRFAAALAERSDFSAAGLAEFSKGWARAHWRRGSFARRLGAMLFGAAEPEQRYRVLERFYRLDRRTIERFYAGSLTLADKARILAGRPPVPVAHALAVLAGLGPSPERLRHAALRADPI